jgi:CheY-like chemotaxis protein
MRDTPLVGLRILIVDDEVLVLMELADMLADLGHIVVASENRLESALAIARTEPIDMAILDINLRGLTSFPVAQVLRRRGVAVIFASGYGPSGLNEEFREAHFLSKPYCMDTLGAMVVKAHDAMSALPSNRKLRHSQNHLH